MKQQLIVCNNCFDCTYKNKARYVCYKGFHVYNIFHVKEKFYCVNVGKYITWIDKNELEYFMRKGLSNNDFKISD